MKNLTRLLAVLCSVFLAGNTIAQPKKNSSISLAQSDMPNNPGIDKLSGIKSQEHYQKEDSNCVVKFGHN